MFDPTSGAFWAALGSIILANIVLSGDNAVVIAMAARSLPPERQRQAIVWGSAAAIVMRIGLTVLAAEMLQWPFLKVAGAAFLVYIGVTLMTDEMAPDAEGATTPSVGTAIRTILLADLVMSLDNVLAVAAAANGNIPLLAIGLAVSVPLIVFGSTLLVKVMARFPIIVTLGAALLGYLAGTMLLTDPAVESRFGSLPEALVMGAGGVGAVFVVVVGRVLRRRG